MQSLKYPKMGDMDAIRQLLALNMKRLRAVRNFTQYDLAEESGVSASTIRKLESYAAFASSEILVKLAKALKAEPSELFRGTEAGRPSPREALRIVTEVVEKHSKP